MSTLPFLLSVADELDNLSNRSYLDDFGLGFYPHRHYHRNPSLQLSLPSHSEWLEQRRSRRHIPKEPTSTVDKSGFQVRMDVQQFKPNELTVKTVENCVVVEAKHAEREDGEGYISRQFVRRYELPDGYDPEEVVSTLSSDGVLTVTVPPPAKSLEPNERVIQIQHIGPAHLSVKDNATNETNGEAEIAGKDE